ncbi:MAG TPA: amidohydrolase family protein [Vicinamibacterales bacterium]|nr:amidohydrolase family protein [Vicinamibacterales bacterium]
MRIDSHQHFWRYTPDEYGWIEASMAALRRDFLPAELRREMDGAAIDVCIAVQARQTAEETRWLLEIADAHPFVAGVIGWIDLQADDAAEQLDMFVDHAKLVGLRHIVQAEPDDRFMLRPAFCRGLSLLEDRDLTYDIVIYPKHLSVAAELVARFPRQRFVLDHLAKPAIRAREMREWEDGIRAIAEFPLVFCKLSGLVTEADWSRWTPDDIHPYLDVAFHYFGPDRLLAGSDWPVCTLAADYRRTIGLVDDYLTDKPAAERHAVMGGNAERLWRLPVPDSKVCRTP